MANSKWIKDPTEVESTPKDETPEGRNPQVNEDKASKAIRELFEPLRGKQKAEVDLGGSSEEDVKEKSKESNSSPEGSVGKTEQGNKEDEGKRGLDEQLLAEKLEKFKEEFSKKIENRIKAELEGKSIEEQLKLLRHELTIQKIERAAEPVKEVLKEVTETYGLGVAELYELRDIIIANQITNPELIRDIAFARFGRKQNNNVNSIGKTITPTGSYVAPSTSTPKVRYDATRPKDRKLAIKEFLDRYYQE